MPVLCLRLADAGEYVIQQFAIVCVHVLCVMRVCFPVDATIRILFSEVESTNSAR